MITEIFGSLTTGVSEKKSITLKNNGGIIIIDVDESKFTSEMTKQLKQVNFNFYLNDNTTEPKKVVFAERSWTSDQDRAIAFNQVPAASYVEVVVLLDESYILANNLIPIQEFPIKVSISDENILSKAGGSGAIDSEIDAKINAHNTSSTAHEDIRKLVSKAVKYRGSVENYSDLPANPNDGDMYNIVNSDIEHHINAGDNVVWVADQRIWDNLGGFIDLSQLQVMIDFPSWLTEVTSDTTKTMNDVVSVLDKNVTTTGLIYMGGLSVADLPENSMLQAETTIEVMKSSNGDPLYKFTLISTNVSPYMWTAIGYNNVFDGWQARPTGEDLLDYVKNTDYATSNKAGVAKITPNNGLTMISGGFLQISTATDEQIAERTSFKPLTTSILNKSVKAALTDANRISDMTDEEKANARGVIGAASEVDLSAKQDILTFDDTPTVDSNNPVKSSGIFNALSNKVNTTDIASFSKLGLVQASSSFAIGVNSSGILYISKATNDMIDKRVDAYHPIVPNNLDYAVRSVNPEVKTDLNTIIKNCIYDLGEQTTLTVELPTNCKVGDWLQFDFISGSTATKLMITSTAGILGYDLIPEVNTIYSLYCDWGTIGNSADSITYGWRFGYSEYPLNF